MKYLWPVLVLIVALCLFALLVFFRSPPEMTEPEPHLPTVEFIRAEPKTVRLTVRSQGAVAPRTETDLTPEVSGRVLRVVDAFENGSFFEAGDLLLEIDPLPLESAVAEARAALATARLALAQEIAQGEQAVEDWAELGQGTPGPLVQRVPQQEKARADVEAAETRLRVAERNLENTRVRAPYVGRTRERRVDVGQVVMANTTVLGRVYAIDFAEVRLPLSLREADLLDLPAPGSRAIGNGPVVRLSARSGDAVNEWTGHIVRAEAALDPRTRLLNLIARIDDPFARADGSTHAPLTPGRFLEAEIEGVALEDAFRLPRSALADSRTVRVLDQDDRLVTREVTIRHTTPADIVVTEGIQPGDRVAVSSIEFFVENMPVRAVKQTDAPNAEARTQGEPAR
ncbi:MAG: efflux RND transporter periplasmic adaptor subunit [Opitutales bacterium]|nr:efflux RND transporter periplasmic adaptor subunit [Opitutales bacterium]